MCDNSYRQSIPKSALNDGENNIVFKTSKGSYSVEQVRIALEFKESAIKTYFFEINQKTFNEIRDDDKDVELSIRFAEDKARKLAKLDVNGHIETIETDKELFTKNIDSKVSEGNNFVRLEPLDDIEVAELKIELK